MRLLMEALYPNCHVKKTRKGKNNLKINGEFLEVLKFGKQEA